MREEPLHSIVRVQVNLIEGVEGRKLQLVCCVDQQLKNVSRTFSRKPRSEPDRDCLICTVFLMSEVPLYAIGGAQVNLVEGVEGRELQLVCCVDQQRFQRPSLPLDTGRVCESVRTECVRVCGE